MKHFFNGYKNALLRQNVAVEQKASQRLRVCEICPKASERAGIKICGECGCPLAALARQDGKICRNWKVFNLK